MIKLAPSILSADFSKLGDDVKTVFEAGADYLHIDVMDGHFVPNISYGSVVMKSLNGITDISYDVHLMIEDPDKHIEDFITEKTEYITVHQEACVHLNRTIQNIKEHGIKVGVSINPATPISVLAEVLNEVDMILIMSVNPGFGGQKFIPSTINKVKELNKLRKENDYSYLIEIDGGINMGNVKAVKSAGVDIVVAGSAVFGAEDIAKRIKKLKSI
ncbi:MAG TPA: ribulose-phosphate 3-epimerase [Anaerovoracaceae bacterium]|nr:ribulose-phosphate 3-epimerase [Anaerovoracaceae bacterium]